MPHEERGGSYTEDAGARRGARGGIPSATSMASHDSRGVKGTLRDSGAANVAVDDQSGRHRRTAGASVSSLFAP